MEPLRVCHLASGDTWAGAENQIAMLLPELALHKDAALSAIVLNPGQLAQTLRVRGVATAVFDERSDALLALVKKLVAYFSRQHIQVLHTHGYKAHLLGCVSGRLAGVDRFITTIHGSPEPFTGTDKLKMSCYTMLNSFATRFCTDRIITVSNKMRADIAKRAYPPVDTIHNGIEMTDLGASMSTSEIRHSLGVTPGNLVVGSVGRLVPVKGFGAFLKAGQLVRHELPNVTLLLIGDGPSRTDLMTTAERYGLGEHVIFTGHRSDVLQLISAMDVFVISSLHEGIPTVLLEAMSVGVPVVSTAVGGMPEVIDESSGFLVEPGNPQKLADAICRVLRAPDACRAVVNHAHTKVQNDFSTKRQAAKVHALYMETAGGMHP